MALVPKTPHAMNVFRSAWIPAPPPESDPATVSTLGTCDHGVHPTLRPLRSPDVRPLAPVPFP